MWERLAEWWRIRTAVHVLEHLDDRMLEDMGLGREDLRERVRGRAEAERGSRAREGAGRAAERRVARRPLVR